MISERLHNTLLGSSLWLSAFLGGSHCMCVPCESYRGLWPKVIKCDLTWYIRILHCKRQTPLSLNEVAHSWEPSLELRAMPPNWSPERIAARGPRLWAQISYCRPQWHRTLNTAVAASGGRTHCHPLTQVTVSLFLCLVTQRSPVPGPQPPQPPVRAW